MILTFCIANQTPMFPLPDDIPVVWLGNGRPITNGSHVIIHPIEFDMEADTWHVFLGGSLGAFAIERILTSNIVEWNENDLISIVHYRKFTTCKQVGHAASNFPGMRISHPKDLTSFDLHAIQNALNTPYLLAQPWTGMGMYHQYASSHCAPDLLRYIAIAVDLNIISWEQSIEMLNYNVIIPGGVECGIYPIVVFIEMIRNFRKICLEFLTLHRPVSIKPYNRRALAFCNERLGGYLLHKRLLQEYNGEIPLEILGYMVNVTESDRYTSA